MSAHWLEELSARAHAAIAPEGVIQRQGDQTPTVLKTLKPIVAATPGEDFLNELRNDRDWAGTRKVGKRIGLHPQTVRNKIKFEGLPARKVGHRWECFLPAVADWLERIPAAMGTVKVPRKNGRSSP